MHRAWPGPSAKIDHFRAFLAPAWVHRVCPFLLPLFRPVLLMAASKGWTGLCPAFCRDPSRHVSRPASCPADLAAEHGAGHARPAPCRRALPSGRSSRHMLRQAAISNPAGHAGGPAAALDEGGKLVSIDRNLAPNLTRVRPVATRFRWSLCTHKHVRCSVIRTAQTSSRRGADRYSQSDPCPIWCEAALTSCFERARRPD